MKGRILAIDYGTKRVGLAITDPERIVVFPREVLQNKDEAALIQDLSDYCRRNQVTEVLIGIPYNDDQSETALTPLVRSFARKLAEHISLSVIERDEKFTTAEARAMLDLTDISLQEQKRHKDVLAAMIILQEYLDSI